MRSTGRVRPVPGGTIARWEQGHHPRKTVRREAGERWFLQSPKQMVDHGISHNRCSASVFTDDTQSFLNIDLSWRMMMDESGLIQRAGERNEMEDMLSHLLLFVGD